VPRLILHRRITSSCFDSSFIAGLHLRASIHPSSPDNASCLGSSGLRLGCCRIASWCKLWFCRPDEGGTTVIRRWCFGVLADSNRNFRPNSYHWGRWGCELDFRFPSVKLLDWQDHWAQLENSDNVFALVVMAQLRAKSSKRAEERQAWKFQLVQLMYERGYERDVILQLFRVIDWMIRLPEALERQFLESVYQLEESKKMPYVTSAERFGIEKGMQQGMQQGEANMLLRQMTRKYGVDVTAAYREQIEKADAETLLEWSERLLFAEKIEEIFH